MIVVVVSWLKYRLNERKGHVAAVNEWSSIQSMSMNDPKYKEQGKCYERLAGSNILNVNLVPSIEFRMVSQS